MKNIFSPLHITFIVLGAAGGFGYYYFIGCSTGSCPLKSNPWIMTGYGALVGYLVADVIQWFVARNKKKE